MRVPFTLFPTIIAVMLGFAAPAGAQNAENDYGPSPTVRRLAEDGIKLFKDGRYQEAAALLLEAQAQYQAPQYRLYIGRSYQKLGKLVEACEQFEAAAGMTPPEGAPADFKKKFEKAVALAGEDLASLTSTIPTALLAVSGPPSGSIRVTAPTGAVRVLPDGNVLRTQMNVGELDVRIEAPGFIPVNIRIKAAAPQTGGAPQTITITLVPVPATADSQPEPPPSPPPAAPAHSSKNPSLSNKSNSPRERDEIIPASLSHRMQLGAYARGDFQVTHGGAAAVVGISFGVHDFFEPYVGAILGRDVGVEPGVCVYFLRGPLKPKLDVAAPIFFEDTAYAGVRAGAGAQWDPFRNFGVFAQVGGAFFPLVPGGYNQFVFLPSVGVQGRL